LATFCMSCNCFIPLPLLLHHYCIHYKRTIFQAMFYLWAGFGKNLHAVFHCVESLNYLGNLGLKSPSFRVWWSVGHAWRLDGAALSSSVFLSATSACFSCFVSVVLVIFASRSRVQHTEGKIYVYICACGRVTTTTGSMYDTQLFETARIAAPTENESYEAVLAFRPCYTFWCSNKYVKGIGETVSYSENQQQPLREKVTQ
jgi:hypothetical protein